VAAGVDQGGIVEAVLDHVVLWVEDPSASLAFYRDVVGLEPVRAEEYARGDAPFPSVRASAVSIIDLMARDKAPGVDEATGGPGAGFPVNHVCLCVSAEDLDALTGRLEAAGRARYGDVAGAFGARGGAARGFYFRDPDGNVLEVRHYA
jgi:catechol 2,3-dioxygenase-like lactoylglutathione lyase family enzyme